MVKHTRLPWISAGFEILPPTLMVALGHPWLGAATLSAVLASSALQSRMVVRSAQQRHQAILSYAQDATTMGGDPSTVIAALRGSTDNAEDGVPVELSLRGHDTRGYKQGREPAATWQYRTPLG